ncbi:MAG: SCO family protein [Pseudomonadota bacterium]
MVATTAARASASVRLTPRRARARWARRGAAAAREFKVYYAKVPTGSGYTMDHSAQTYLIDAQGRLRIVLKHEPTADDDAHDIAWLLRGGA